MGVGGSMPTRLTEAILLELLTASKCLGGDVDMERDEAEQDDGDEVLGGG